MPKMKRRRRRPERQATDMHTVASFCAANNISIPFYYALRARGEGPRETRLGRKVLISPEAELEWRREREAAS